MKKGEVQQIIEGVEGAFLMGVHILFPLFLHHGRVRWGATVEELSRTWLGDELIEHPRAGFTHGITIAAPSSRVWQWVAQIGQDKAGFYSYEFLENLVGCQIHNAERLYPEWSRVRVGDVLRFHPKATPAPVIAVEEGHGFLIGGFINLETGEGLDFHAALPAKYVKITWLFYTYDVGEGQSRFISRWRTDFSPGFINELAFGRYLLEPIAAVMDQKMCRGIKQRAENAARE